MASAPIEDWSEEVCIKLIREYRKRPVLWDPKDPYYFKKQMKPEAWEGIGEALGFSAEVCKRKMAILQSSFRREKAKIMSSLRDTSDPDNVYVSGWFAFEEMMFLIEKDSERKRQSTNLPEDFEENSVSSIKRILMKHCKPDSKKKPKLIVNSNGTFSTEPGIIRESPSRQFTTSVLIQPLTDKPMGKSTMPNVPPLTPGPPPRSNEETLEEIKSFTNFIAFKMKKYSETTKNAVQQAICDVIFKADQNYYETVSFDANFGNIQTLHADVMSNEDCDTDKIDIGNGQTIKLQLDDSD